MSKQFRFYLLPSDIESLVVELRARIGVKIIEPEVPSLELVEVTSPIREDSHRLRTRESVHVRCFLTPPREADIRMRFIQSQSHWNVEMESEVIEFSGCDYDGSTLLIGRFYYQNDILMGDTIWPKRKEFVEWADRIFLTTKKLLHRSKALDAYVGEDAEKWRLNGGRFASGF